MTVQTPPAKELTKELTREVAFEKCLSGRTKKLLALKQKIQCVY